VSALTFLVFLKRLASSFGNNRSERLAENVLLLWLSCLGVYLVTFCLVLLMLRLWNETTLWEIIRIPGGIPGLALLALLFVLAVLMAGLGLLAFVRYCNLLTSLRESLLRLVAQASAPTKKLGLLPVDRVIHV
jgi:hypothetical protein